MPDKPWVMRTYSGHSSARASNELYRTNRAKGQTGLSIAFDLPTQTGYDPDSPEAKGEVGKVGVPVAHLGHMRQLMDGIPVGEMNTVKVARQGEERESAELWLAVDRSYIPVRLVVVEKDGTRYEQVATRISQ